MQLALTAPDLWQAAHAALKELFLLITGTTPAHLQALKRRERKQLRDWLAALEAMVRRVLLIEAAAFMDRRRPRRHTSIKRVNAGEAPAVQIKRAPTFTLLPAQARERQHPARIRMLGAPTSLAELLRQKARAQRIAALRNAPPSAPHAALANRISAIARVIANPRATIRALARRLRKSRQIGFAITTARAPTPFTFPGDAPRAATTRAIAAITTRDSS